MTVLAALAAGYRIQRRGSAWYLRTPEAGWLICPSQSVAWRTLWRITR